MPRRCSNDSEVQYNFVPKVERRCIILALFIACLALILGIIVGIFTIRNWELYKQLLESQNKLTTDMEVQKEAQSQFLSELTDLMAQQEKTHQYSLEELEQKMKKSLEERGYNTAHFSSSGSRLVSTWSLVLSITMMMTPYLLLVLAKPFIALY